MLFAVKRSGLVLGSIALLCMVSNAVAFAPTLGALPRVSTSSLQGGHTLPAATSLRTAASVCGGLEMGKGKGTPINQRGEMMKRQQMAEMQQQMMGDDRSATKRCPRQACEELFRY